MLSGGAVAVLRQDVSALFKLQCFIYIYIYIYIYVVESCTVPSAVQSSVKLTPCRLVNIFRRFEGT
jgi:hypothetical protein